MAGRDKPGHGRCGWRRLGAFDGIVLAVRHSEIAAMSIGELRQRLSSPAGFIYDVKEVLPVSQSDVRL